MPQFQTVKMPPQLWELYQAGQKSRELYRIVYISFCRPDARNVVETVPLEVVVHVFAKDADEARALLQSNIPRVDIGGLDTELRPLSVVRVESTGITEDSMLEIAAGAGEGGSGSGEPLQFVPRGDLQ